MGKRPRVLITGAAGLVGAILVSGLEDSHDLTGIDRRILGRPRGIRRLDTRRLRSLERTVRGHDVLVDLATDPRPDAPWPVVLRNNVPAALSALQAAARAGVRRVIYASSNHVTGMYERDEPYASVLAGRLDGLHPDRIPRIDPSFPIRPSGPYGVGKALGEAAGRYFSDRFGLSVICLRIGGVRRNDRPATTRDLAVLLSHRDLVHLLTRCIEAPDDVRFAIFYGVSRNTWRIWDISAARDAIGYEPQDDAEAFRDDPRLRPWTPAQWEPGPG